MAIGTAAQARQIIQVPPPSPHGISDASTAASMVAVLLLDVASMRPSCLDASTQY